MKKNVLLIYTGGTIGMVPSDRGYVPEKGYMARLLPQLQELGMKEMPDYDLFEYDPLLDSSYITVWQWMKIAGDIVKNYDGYDGFVILHGTDTMAYTASALSFMLDGLSKPVVLTGSQIPFCEIRNDARDNLVTAMIIAANYDVPEVCLYFGGMLMRGNRATKISADDLTAFDSPNYPLLAEAGVRIELYKKNIRAGGKELRLIAFDPCQIAVIKVFPGIEFEIFEKLMTKKLRGLVIEGFGSGNIPKGGGALDRMLQTAQENGTAVVVCTQCLKGFAVVGAYEASNILHEAGVISGYDMTVEAAVTKLYYLTSAGYELSAVKKLMETDLRGEMTRYGKEVTL